MPTPASPARSLVAVSIAAAAVAVALWLADWAIRATFGGESPMSSTPTAVRPPCPDRIDDLDLPDEIDRADPRLGSDLLLIAVKSSGRLLRLVGGEVVDCWPASFGPEPGHKQIEGDRRTPEGWYRTSDKPESAYSGAISVHYPNQADADLALAAGAIDDATHQAISQALAGGLRPPQRTPLGGDILIHGNGEPWTLGCVSLSDGDLGALRAVLPSGMAVDLLIVP